GLLKYLTPDEFKKGMEFRLDPELSFNYLGQFSRDNNGDIREGPDVLKGDLVSPESERLHVLDMLSFVSGGSLRVTVNYNRHEYEEQTILDLLDKYINKLQQIITHCTEKEDSEKTLSDFSHSRLSKRDFDDLIDNLNDMFK
ncbi:MAG: condensation domain-containing protein, partial [Bacillota bacterium]